MVRKGFLEEVVLELRRNGWLEVIKIEKEISVCRDRKQCKQSPEVNVAWFDKSCVRSDGTKIWDWEAESS